MTNPIHIMLVEDNPDDYEATIRSFKKHHFLNSVKWCRSGQDAVNYLKKQPPYTDDTTVARPGLILLDLNMPGIDGREVLEIIKKDPALKSIPVVILTTSKDQHDIDTCYSLGASTYIQKPVSFEGLTEAVHTMKDYWFNIAILPGEDT